jgi:ankyrin repeat protein
MNIVHWAAKKGDYEMLTTLASYGAQLSVPTEADALMFPIHWAASDGKISSIRFFLENNQDINVQDANGCTPLIVAAQHNHINCVVFLIENGADISISDSNGVG